MGSGGAVNGGGPNEHSLGNILIISEDGDASDPDDEWQGGDLIFTFDEPVRIDHLELLDIDSDENGGSVITLTSGSGTQSVSIPALGNNSFQQIQLGADELDF